MYSRSDDSRVIPLTTKQQTTPFFRRLPKIQVIIILAFFIWACYTYFFIQLPNMHKLGLERQQLSQKLADIELKNTQLQETIKKLNDDAYISELARVKYNMKKPGDVILNP
ncbi:septum formation initiator family protein [Fodinisporobacter ferrooxydans]|uniref:Septum formation initiator family protein n=1 Tax=Fodinisporobacter ferrooxydans TaxID=2901836 RepID=A0ABY4CMW0_9BACL|nr:septum formation initiator family protein [Alicyclobacillaceae bacterium MYW30-H2]